jgi:hypothetical protein
VENADLVALVNIVALVAYAGLLLFGAVLTAARLLLYAMGRVTRPRLLNRDLIFIGGHAMTMLLILVIRVVPEWGTAVRGQLWWTVLTAAPALAGVAAYVYFEVFVIAPMYSRHYDGGDHNRRGDDRDQTP